MPRDAIFAKLLSMPMLLFGMFILMPKSDSYMYHGTACERRNPLSIFPDLVQSEGELGYLAKATCNLGGAF